MKYCTYRVVLARVRSKVLIEIPLGAEMDAHLAGEVNRYGQKKFLKELR